MDPPLQISRMWFPVAEVLRIRDKPVTVYDESDFARILRDELGDDAERYYREILNGWSDKECCGECDKLYEAHEFYQRVLHDVLDELLELANSAINQTKTETATGIRKITKMISSNL